jgi:hypothetical protein
LTRRAVELALAGDPTAMRLCLERIPPPCRERTVRFALPPIESAPTGQSPWLKAHDIAAAMKAVTSALASGAIAPGEAERIAAVVDTFVRAIDASDFDRRLQELEDASKARCDPHCRVGVALAQQPIGECLLLICCRCSNVKQSVQFSIANRGHGHWQNGMLFAIIREGMAGDNHRGQHGAPA